MAYIGQRPVIGRYIKLDQISSGFNGSNTGFSMTAGSQAVFPGTARNLLLSLGGVIQEPDTDFTISGSTLTFTTPPVANTTFFGVIYGDMQATGTPSDGTVLPASIASSGNFSFPQVTVTSNLTISSDSPKIFLTDTGDDDDFEIRNDDGTFTIRNSTDGNDIISVASDNATTFTGAITASSTSTFLGSAVFNENGGNVDFRVEGDTEANLLFVDASADKIGIGTSSPTKTLTVQGDILKTRSDSGVGLIYLQNDGSNNGNIVINQNGGVTRVQLHSDGDSYFNGGDVGIGTTSPDRLLHVRSTGDALFRITSGDGSAAYIELGDASDGDAGKIVYDNGDNLTFTTTNPSNNQTVEKLRIQGDGKVGIGTSSPNAKLTICETGTLTGGDINLNADGLVIDNNGGNTGITFKTPNSASSRIAFGDPEDNNVGQILYNHATDDLTITAADNVIFSCDHVGIGTSAPEGTGLDVTNTRTNGYTTNTDTRNLAHIICRNSSDAPGRFAALSFINGGGTQAEGSINLVQQGNYVGDLTFKLRTDVSAWAERLRINTSGQLLVGVSSSLGVLGLAAQLQIAGDSAGGSSLALRRFGNSAQGAFLTFSKSRDAADNSRTIAADGDELGRIAFCMDDGNDLAHAGAEVRANVDGTPGSDDTPGRLVFLTTQAGNNGNLTERFRINNIGNLHWRNNNVKQRKIYFFLSQSGDTQLDTKLSENFSNNDMLRVDYAYNWNAGDGGAWGTAVVWKQYEGTLRYRLLGEETASPAEFVAFYIRWEDVFIRFGLVATSGMNGYAMLNVETGGCDPRAF